jgi:hypothetical protein
MPVPLLYRLGFSSRYGCIDDKATCYSSHVLFRLRNFSPKEEEIFANLTSSSDWNSANVTSSGDWNALPWDLKVEPWSLCYSMCISFCCLRVLHIFFLTYLPLSSCLSFVSDSCIAYVWHRFVIVLTFKVCSKLGYIVSIFAW